MEITLSSSAFKENQSIPGRYTYDAENLSPPLSWSGAAADTRQNDFRKTGYDGACPPPGSDHRYFFKLYALDTEIELPEGATKAEVEKAIQDHIISMGQLIGLYGR